MKTKQRRSDGHGLVEYKHATIPADICRQSNVEATVMVCLEEYMYKHATIPADL